MTDYQHEYEMMMAWAMPHHHDFRLDVSRMVYRCSGCGSEEDAESVHARRNAIRKSWTRQYGATASW